MSAEGVPRTVVAEVTDLLNRNSPDGVRWEVEATFLPRKHGFTLTCRPVKEKP